MALFDFLKRKKEVEKAKPVKKEKSTEKEVEKILIKKKTIKKEKNIKTDNLNVPNKKNKDNNFSYETIKEPHVSEKASYLTEAHKYTFKIYDNSNKSEIKKSIEGIYGVNVLSVNIIKIPAKKRRIGRTEGFKKGYNKAIVTIKEGQKIEIL